MDKANKKLISVLYANRATAYTKLKKDNEAINDLTESLKYNNQYAKAYYKRGYIYENKGEYDDAVSDYSDA